MTVHTKRKRIPIKMRGKVYAAIAAARDRGATRAELVEFCGIKLQTVIN